MEARRTEGSEKDRMTSEGTRLGGREKDRMTSEGTRLGGSNCSELVVVTSCCYNQLTDEHLLDYL